MTRLFVEISFHITKTVSQKYLFFQTDAKVKKGSSSFWFLTFILMSRLQISLQMKNNSKHTFKIDVPNNKRFLIKTNVLISLIFPTVVYTVWNSDSIHKLNLHTTMECDHCDLVVDFFIWLIRTGRSILFSTIFILWRCTDYEIIRIIPTYHNN